MVKVAWCCLNDSLTMRLILLRPVACRQFFFEIAKPSRATSLFVSLHRTVNHSSRLRTACLNTRPNAAASRSRLPRRNRCNELPVSPCSLSAAAMTARKRYRGLRGQLRAALGAPTIQHQTPGLGGHAGTEPVCACALQCAGLIRTFHLPGTWCSAGKTRAGDSEGRQAYQMARQCQ